MMFLCSVGLRLCHSTVLPPGWPGTRRVTAWISRCLASLIVCAPCMGVCAAPQETDGEPVLRLDTGGPTSYVSSLVFAGDSQTLYAGGFDKLVLAWTRQNDQFESNPNETMRFPIGPGLYGAINAVAVSTDGRYVAVAGRGFVEGAAGFRQPGRILYSSGGMTREMRRDEGTIYVVDSQTHVTHQLRGHLGPVVALMFAPETDGTFVLVSAAQETSSQSAKLRAVLRMWDVGQRKHLRSTYVTLDEQSRFEQSVGYSAEKTPPGLAVRRIGPQPLDLQVAVAWNDGVTRLWDPRPEPTGSLLKLGAMQNSPEGLRNCTIAYLPDGRMLTAGSSGWSGQLHIWQPGPDQLPRRSGDAINFSVNGLPVLPRAIAAFRRDSTTYVALASLTFARAPGGATRLEPDGVELRIVDLDQRRIVVQKLLWQIDRVYGVPLPSLAVSSDGDWVAISGGPNHEIWLFKTSDLMESEVQPQKLSSRTLNLNEGFFLRREGARGLCFRGEGSGDRLVYDLETRELKPLVRGAGWVYDRMQVSGWNVQSQTVGQAAERRLVLRVRGPGGFQSEVRLPSEQEEVTATAVLRAATYPPLLAVASHELGQPLLTVFNLETGEKLRHYTGHTERIRTLSASADGRLLISTAEDQTASVWSLTDLDAILGRHGMLIGVAVEDADDGTLKVVRVDSESPSAGQLAVGDQILGRVESGQLQQWSTAREFYDSWWLTAPGTQVALRRQRGPNDVRDVNLTVGQGVDERKPLFSFFVARPTEGRPLQWIGWSPLGPFDSSDEEIERHLGWHFNTGDSERPTAFADLNQYRDQYFRAGLLRDLVTHGALLAPREPDPPPPPKMFLWIPEIGPQPEAADGQWVLRQREPVTLALDLDSAFPDDLIQSIECQLDGQRLGEMQRHGDRRWEMDLSQVDWQRDARNVQVVLNTSERRPRVFEQVLRVRYQPPAPVIRLTNEELSEDASATLSADRFTVRAQVQPGEEGETLEVRLYELRPQERKLIDSWTLDQTAELVREVPVTIGTQHLQWEAQNARASEDLRELETTRQSLKITRTEPERPATPPRIALQVTAPSANAGPLQFGQRLLCASPRLELSGVITTEDPLDAATIQLSHVGRARPLSPVVSSANPNQFEFRETIEDLPLEPTHVVCFARTRNGLTAEFYLQIEYTPPLPELVLVRPRASERGMFLQEETATVEMEADLQFPDDVEVPESVLQQLRATVLRAGSDPQPAEIDTAQRKLVAPVTVPSGNHQLQLAVHYAWNPSHRRESEPITIIGVPKPRVVRAELQRLDGKITGDLSLDVQVDSNVSEVYIGSQELSPASWTFDSPRQRLQVAATIPVVEQQQVSVRVAGVADPFRFPLPPVQTIEQPKAPPEVMFLSPSRDIGTQQWLWPLRFSVRSAKPINRVELRQNRIPIIVWNEEELERRLVQTGQLFSLEEMTPLSLSSGNNSLELIAENADGLAKQSVMISVPESPIRVEVAVKSADGTDITKSTAHTVEDPLVTVHGRIVFRKPNDPRISQEQLVKVWVGGFLQAVKYLGPAERDAVREFEIPIILSRRNNPIEVELPGLQHDVRDTRQLYCAVRCLQPHERYRLHLLVIGVGKQLNDQALVEDALRTLEATPTDETPSRYRTPVFQDVEIYRPLVNESISVGTLNSRLGDIDRAIYTRKRENPDMRKTYQDVVMVYYTGGELIASERQFYLTTKPNQPPTDVVDYGISSDRLRDFVEMNLGAHLLLLDVSRTCDEYCDARTWPSTSHGAMLRFAWTNPQSPMPETAHLMNVMQQLDPERGELGQLEQQLKDHAAKTDALIYDGLVPGSMLGLPLRGRLP